MDLSEALYMQLNILGFPEFLKTEGRKYGFDHVQFTSNMFSKDGKESKAASQSLYFFLFRKISKSLKDTQWEKDSRSCFPCLDAVQEADFRKVVQRFLHSIEKEPDISKSAKTFNSCLMNPSSFGFIHLTLRVITTLMTKLVSPESRRTIRSAKKQDMEGHVKEAIVGRQEILRSHGVAAEAIHVSIEPMKNRLNDLLLEREALLTNITQLKKRSEQLFGADWQEYTAFNEVLPRIQKQIKKAVTVNNYPVDQIKKALNSNAKAGDDIILGQLLKETLFALKEVRNGTSHTSSSDLENFHVMNLQGREKMSKVKDELTSLWKSLSTLKSEEDAKCREIKSKVANNSNFRKMLFETMKIIGITRPLPVIRFRPRAPISDTHVQRWRSLGHRLESRTSYSRSSLSARHSISSRPSDADENIVEVSPCRDISFNISQLDHTVFVRNYSSIGIFQDIPESDNEDDDQ